MSNFRRSSYASVLLLSMQSYRSSQSMTSQLLQMSKSLAQSDLYTSKSSIDTGLADEFTKGAAMDQSRASTLQKHAGELEAESLREKALAQENRIQEHQYETKAAGEQGDADALSLEAASQEAIFVEQSDHAAAESLAAAEEMEKTESDAAATGVCEFIPFLDIVCDVIGGVAALGFESHAAKLAAQSAVDETAAAMAKVKEEQLLGEVEALEGEAAGDEATAGGYAAKAKEEELLAKEEMAEAEKEEEEAVGLFARSKEEQMSAEEEIAMAEEDEVVAEKELEESLKHGLKAFGDAFLAGIFSIVSWTFFFVRFLVAVIVPGGAAIVGFIPYSVTVASTGEKVANAKEWAGNAWSLFPKREISYLASHCWVFLVTMIGFGSRLDGMEKMSIRTQGDVILSFAAVAALVQSLLFHSLPAVMTMRGGDGDEGRSTSRSMGGVVGGALFTAARGMLYLVPLFMMELCELRLLSSKYFFAVDLPNFMSMPVLCALLLLLGVLFAVTHERDSVSTTSTGNDSSNDDDSPNNSNAVPDTGTTEHQEESNENENESPELVSLLRRNNEEANNYNGCDVESSRSKDIEEQEERRLMQENDHDDGNSCCSSEDGKSFLSDRSEDGKSFISDLTADTFANSSFVMSYMNRGTSTRRATNTGTADAASNTGMCSQMNQAIHQYISDLKLPFEILIMTCMFVKLAECCPIVFKLLPQVLKSHPHFFAECSVLLVGIAVVMWFLLSKDEKKSRGHVGIWTGRFGRERSS